jgi:hypothetical protein
MEAEAPPAKVIFKRRQHIKKARQICRAFRVLKRKNLI